PGFGICSVGPTAADADVALDIYEHTIAVMTSASGVGSYEPVGRGDLFDMEYWSLEQAKLKPPVLSPLSRCVAVVTGAASGIGLATAGRFLAGGAHVAMVDRDAGALSTAADTLSKKHRGRVLALPADVLSAEAVDGVVRQVVRAWGGLDVLVSNAGNATEGRLQTASGQAAMRDSFELNCASHARVAGLAVDVMVAQRRGGCLLFNASKSAFNQGPGFGPYAIAKTALVALMRQFAVDLGGQAIRSNAVNA